MALNNNGDRTVEYVMATLQIRKGACVRVAKEGMFQPAKDVVAKYREMFRQRGLEIVIDCVEDSERPREFFKLYIRKKE